MEVELVFAGLTTLVNVDNADESVLGPSAILLNPDYEGPHAASAKMPNHHHGGNMSATDDQTDNMTHIPFIAFDSRLAAVDTGDGFEPVKDADPFLFLNLDKDYPNGVEISIKSHLRYIPTIDDTFGNIASRSIYWPESIGQWNYECVPPAGDRPKKEAVKAFFRLGAGKLAAGRICPYKWKFTKLNGDTIIRNFAEEATYSYRETEEYSVTIDLYDLETKRDEDEDTLPLRTLIFTPYENATRDLTLFIGNSVVEDMDDVVRRRRSKSTVGTSSHFYLFNNVVDVGQAGAPKPPVGVKPGNIEDGRDGAGGSDGGICGPAG
jgi:hypothetical protein